jgi:hypothetical protein
MLKAVGYWITGLQDEKLPAPQELVGVMPADQRDRLTDYLAAGMTQVSYLGMSWCRFGCGIDFELMGSRDLTDGAWVWPEGLAHYVREHQVVLPDEFTTQALSRETPVVVGWIDEFARAAQHRRPDKPAELEEPEASVDYTFWHEWCASRRSAQTLQRLREARQRAESLMASDAAAERAKAIDTALAQHGVSQANCLQKNCGQKALTGTYLCVEHYLGKPSPDPLRRMGNALHELLGEFSREIGLTPDFSIHAPPVLPRGRRNFGSFVMRLFKRLRAPMPDAPTFRTLARPKPPATSAASDPPERSPPVPPR